MTLAKEMKTKILLTSILGLLGTFGAFAEEIPQALVLALPDTWNVEYKGDHGSQSYFMSSEEGGTVFLMFSRPHPFNPEQLTDYIAGQIEKEAEDFIVQSDKNNVRLKEQRYELKEIKGNTFSGKSVEFNLEAGVTQTILIIGDKD